MEDDPIIWVPATQVRNLDEVSDFARASGHYGHLGSEPVMEALSVSLCL